MGEKYVQEKFLGEESLGEKYIGEKYVQEEHGSLNVPIEHHPTIRYMVHNGYY